MMFESVISFIVGALVIAVIVGVVWTRRLGTEVDKCRADHVYYDKRIEDLGDRMATIEYKRAKEHHEMEDDGK